VKPVSFARFRLYTLGMSRPAELKGRIVEIWEDEAEGELAVLAEARNGEVNALILVRDGRGRFTPAALAQSQPTLSAARGGLEAALAGATRPPAPSPTGGLDLLTPVAAAGQLHPYFENLRSDPHKAAARRVFAELGRWLAPTDRHFVREFQTAGFDQRLWETYLWACFRELGFDVGQPEHPDFVLRRRGNLLFSAEATTVGPSAGGVLAEHPDPQTQDEMAAFLRDYMPMKFGGTLTAKLDKRIKGKAYWELPATEGAPFVIAVADFHVAASRREPGSMVYSQSGLPIYLYGTEYSAEHDAKGELKIGYNQRQAHVYKAKKIESGFFDLPGADNVAAVLFSNAGTIAKFNRMGVVAGFAPPDMRYIRRGFAFDPDPDAALGMPFAVDVADPRYREDWCDELQVFHNPRAKLPLDPDLMPDATHHFWEDDVIVSYERAGRVLTSITLTLSTCGREGEKA